MCGLPIIDVYLPQLPQLQAKTKLVRWHDVDAGNDPSCDRLI